MKWYALFVETGRETQIQKWIQYFFDPSECYSVVPKKKSTEKRQGIKHQVIRTLFPGYVFIKTDMCVEIYYKLARVPNIIRILNNGFYWSYIEDVEMALIMKLVGDNGIVYLFQSAFRKYQNVCKRGPSAGNGRNDQTCGQEKKQGYDYA